MGLRIDRERSRARIERDIETLGGPAYTLSERAICRYAYTEVYRATLDYFTAELERIGFSVWHDPVGTLIASNVAPGAAAFGIGSHCDSNRNGGKYDGTLGVCTALEVCRLAAEAGDGLPLRLISFLEEEGSGFGQMLLGSRIMLQRVTEDELRETFRDEHGVSFWDSAEGAGYERTLARVDSRARRPHRLDRDAHRAGAGASGHRNASSVSSRRSSDTSTEICTSAAGPITPAPRRWTSASTQPSRRPRRSSSSSAWLMRLDRRGRGHRGGDLGAARPDQRRPVRRAPSLDFALGHESAQGVARDRPLRARWRERSPWPERRMEPAQASRPMWSRP